MHTRDPKKASSSRQSDPSDVDAHDLPATVTSILPNPDVLYYTKSGRTTWGKRYTTLLPWVSGQKGINLLAWVSSFPLVLYAHIHDYTGSSAHP